MLVQQALNLRFRTLFKITKENILQRRQANGGLEALDDLPQSGA